jgi:hypothetical protein
MIEEEHESDQSSQFMRNLTAGGRESDPAYGGTYQLVSPNSSLLGGREQRESRERGNSPRNQNPPQQQSGESNQNPPQQQSGESNQITDNIQGALTGGRLNGPRVPKLGGNPFSN